MTSSINRPNIVFFFADDWGRYASAYSKFEGDDSINHLLSTPNFDRIASEGAIFTNAFVPAPHCTPCRSSLLSGTYFWETGLGAILQGAEWDTNIPSYPLMLEEKGYHIGYSYKVWQPGVPADAPYGGTRTCYQPAGNKWAEFSQEVTKRVSDLGLDGAKQVLFDEVRENFLGFVDDVPDGKPFCYWWGPVNTHRRWEKGSGKALWGLEPDDLKGKMPEFMPDVHEIREDFVDYLGEAQAFDAGIGVILEELENMGELDNTFIVVSGDHGIPGFPRAKKNLYDLGSEVALAARWPGKIEAGQVLQEFVNIMSLAPTFLEAAGEQPNDNMADSLLPLMTGSSEINLESDGEYVVLGCERHIAFAREGGLPYPSRAIRTRDYIYIHNFAPDRWPMGSPDGLEDPNVVNEEEIYKMGDYTEYYFFAGSRPVYAEWDGGPTKQWMLLNRSTPEVKPNFDLAVGKRPAQELYDLKKDPDYMVNVADDGSYSEVLKNLSSKLFEVLKKHNDPRIVDENCRFERYPFAGPKENLYSQSTHSNYDSDFRGRE